uniref:F-box domain-containing protein n=1 Tax=Auxenochlorella protothecoides TaxID=3075 RepID=A0A1D1ZPB6_AUXPR
MVACIRTAGLQQIHHGSLDPGRHTANARTLPPAAHSSSCPPGNIPIHHSSMHCSMITPQGAGTADSTPDMLTLPEPLLLRLVCFLSPDDTLSLAQTCRHLARLAGEDLVWRRHFLYRWPDAGMQDEGATPAWKARYMARDRAGVAAVSATGLDPALGPLYRHMAVAKRSEAVPPAWRAPAGPGPAPVGATRVAAFRAARGIPPAGPHPRACGAGACSYRAVGADTWVCETCGHAHVCDAHCALGRGAGEGELPVCAASGRCLACWEEGGGDGEVGAAEAAAAALAGRWADAGSAEDWNAEEGMGGRLGRAFFAGYNAANADELMLRFGVRL